MVKFVNFIEKTVYAMEWSANRLELLKMAALMFMMCNEAMDL